MGCLSGHVYYATRILSFWMLARAVTRSVYVSYFVVIVGLLLAAEARGERREGPSLFPVDAAPQDARGRRTCCCAAYAACCCCCSSCGVVMPCGDVVL